MESKGFLHISKCDQQALPSWISSAIYEAIYCILGYRLPRVSLPGGSLAGKPYKQSMEMRQRSRL